MNVRGFAALAKMHRFRMDEHRRKAAEIEQMRLQFIEKDAALEQQLQHEKTVLNPSDIALTDFAAYMKGVELRREELAKSIAETTRHLARINAAMAIEYREAKKFELAMEREEKRRRKHAVKLEQADLDEIGLNYRDRAVF